MLRPSRAARLLSVVIACLVAAAVLVPVQASAKTDPRLTRPLFADPTSTAAVAAQVDKRFASLARTPQAFWATDTLPTATVRKSVEDYTKRAAKQKRTPVVAVYAIPARDCGSHSAGTFDPRTYRRWIAQVAAGLKGAKAIVVLEPDALAMLGQCEQGDRIGLIRYAVGKLKRTGAWVYLDAGHGRWIAPDVMAQRLKAAGISSARGFATNVASFQATADEKVYGDAVVASLRKLRITGKRYVIDTARNGAPTAAGDFCNPVSARVGAKPRIVRRGAIDAYLWVKHPGESDGACNGGPNSGTWWAAGALTLLSR